MRAGPARAAPRARSRRATSISDGHLVPLAWTGVWSDVAQQHIFIGRDMTEQKRAEETQRQLLARQQAIFNSAMVGIITLNESGSIETMNPAAERIFGVTEAEVARRDIGRLIDLGGPERCRARARSFAAWWPRMRACAN